MRCVVRLQVTEEQELLFGIDKLNIPHSHIPGVTHIDYYVRIQTVHKETNLRFHDLISPFEKQTGCPIFINTSFNVRGEQIVSLPEDAHHCFDAYGRCTYSVNRRISYCTIYLHSFL